MTRVSSGLPLFPLSMHYRCGVIRIGLVGEITNPTHREWMRKIQGAMILGKIDSGVPAVCRVPCWFHAGNCNVELRNILATTTEVYCNHRHSLSSLCLGRRWSSVGFDVGSVCPSLGLEPTTVWFSLTPHEIDRSLALPGLALIGHTMIIIGNWLSYTSNWTI